VTKDIAAIVIGRNEGDRLLRCLAALEGRVAPVIYVDSGSTDGSVEAARKTGAEVVELDLSVPFTAARARNAGVSRVPVDIPFIQFLDGDCEMDADWTTVALDVMRREAQVAVVCGRRRERHPDASLWNRLVDAEWNTPIGEANACGGDALIRRAALDDVGGYREDLIAGEEPEMCYRMRLGGWRILRIDAEMTLHDAAMTRLGQWWQRCRRAGHAYAEGALLHGRSLERYNVAETRRALLWGAGLPIFALLGAVTISAWCLLLLLAWPIQVLRLARKMPFEQAVFLTLGKIPEAQGAMGAIWQWLTGTRRGLIEYK
jgi:GT2 family glycosyltransferase